MFRFQQVFIRNFISARNNKNSASPLHKVYTGVKIFTIDSGQDEAHRKEKDLPPVSRGTKITNVTAHVSFKCDFKQRTEKKKGDSVIKPKYKTNVKKERKKRKKRLKRKIHENKEEENNLKYSRIREDKKKRRSLGPR